MHSVIYSAGARKTNFNINFQKSLTKTFLILIINVGVFNQQCYTTQNGGQHE